MARGLRPPNERQLAEAHLEAAAPHAVEQRGDVVREAIVDVADEAQRDVVVFRVDPARAGQAAAQQRQRRRDLARDFQADEQAGHLT